MKGTMSSLDFIYKSGETPMTKMAGGNRYLPVVGDTG